MQKSWKSEICRLPALAVARVCVLGADQNKSRLYMGTGMSCALVQCLPILKETCCHQKKESLMVFSKSWDFNKSAVGGQQDLSSKQRRDHKRRKGALREGSGHAPLEHNIIEIWPSLLKCISYILLFHEQSLVNQRSMYCHGFHVINT